MKFSKVHAGRYEVTDGVNVIEIFQSEVTGRWICVLDGYANDSDRTYREARETATVWLAEFATVADM